MTRIIAEFGSSPAEYNWDLSRWCEAAQVAGANAVKVQLFKAKHFPTAEQDSKRPLEFPRERLAEAARLAHAHGLEFGASVFDLEAVDLAGLHCDFIKLAAREQRNLELLNAALRKHKPVYRSISNLDCFEIIRGVTLFTFQRYPVSMTRALVGLAFAAAYFNVGEYAWGWSSHTTGTLDCVLAARLGARVIEKHLALSNDDLEAGHSLLPRQFYQMTQRIN